ncbi:MarR family winged helix-turn-helix transcriptional regulator [Leuconostoc mesenteroides]
MEKIEKLRYLIKALDVEGENHFAKLLSTIGITPTQNEILKILKAYGSLSISEIGELLICGSDNPSRVIQRLLLKKLIIKQKDLTDSRKNNILITEKGVNVLIEATKIEKKFNNNILEKLENIITVDELIHILTKQIENSKTLNKIKIREQKET